MIKTGITISVLDDFLRILYKKKALSIEQLMDETRANKILLHHLDVLTILEKLQEDKYALKFPNTQYALSVGGRMFFEKGGYEQQKKDRKRKATLEKINIWAVGTGTVLAGIYGFFEILRWLFHHEGWKLFF